jgi:hypothetical protein
LYQKKKKEKKRKKKERNVAGKLTVRVALLHSEARQAESVWRT